LCSSVAIVIVSGVRATVWVVQFQLWSSVVCGPQFV